MKNKVLALLGFAAKANKLSYGMNMTVSAIKSKKSKLTLCSFEISDKSRKEINFFSNKYGVQMLPLNDCGIEELSTALGKRCGIVSVNDTQFATALVREIAEGGNI